MNVSIRSLRFFVLESETIKNEGLAEFSQAPKCYSSSYIPIKSSNDSYADIRCASFLEFE